MLNYQRVAAIARSCKDIVLSCVAGVAVGCSDFEDILVLMGQTWIVPWPMMIEPWLELVKPILFEHFKTHSHVYMYTTMTQVLSIVETQGPLVNFNP